MSERISHSHSLEQKRLKGSPVRCFPLLISKSSLKEHSPPGGGSGRLGDDGESRRRGSALARSSLLQAAPHQPSEPQARHQHPHVPWPAAPAARRARPGSRGAGESSREKSWMGKRLGGLSSSEPTSVLVRRAGAGSNGCTGRTDKVHPPGWAQPSRCRGTTRIMAGVTTCLPSPEKQHSPSPRSQTCPSAGQGPGRNSQCSHFGQDAHDSWFHSAVGLGRSGHPFTPKLPARGAAGSGQSGWQEAGARRRQGPWRGQRGQSRTTVLWQTRGWAWGWHADACCCSGTECTGRAACGKLA